MNENFTYKELRKIAPKLAELDKENPFLLPSGYFDELPQQIQQRLESTPKRTSFFFGTSKLPKIVFAGITLILLLILTYNVFLNNSKEELPIIASEVFFEDHLAWYSEYQTEAYYDMIFSDYDEVNDSGEPDEFTDEQLIEYLLEYDEYFMLPPPSDYALDN